MGCHPSHWLIFFRGVETTNQMCISHKFSQILTISYNLSMCEKNTRCEAHINGRGHLPICRRWQRPVRRRWSPSSLRTITRGSGVCLLVYQTWIEMGDCEGNLYLKKKLVIPLDIIRPHRVPSAETADIGERSQAQGLTVSSLPLLSWGCKFYLSVKIINPPYNEWFESQN